MLTSDFGVGCFLSDLASAVACLFFSLLRLWSSYLSALFAPRAHEPFDDHCLQSPCYSVTLVFLWCDFDSSVFHSAFFLFDLQEHFLLRVHNVRVHSLQPRVAVRLFAVNLIGRTKRRSIVHGSRLFQMSMVKAFRKICFRLRPQCHHSFFLPRTDRTS